MFEACFSVLGDGVRVGGNVQFFSFFTGLYIRCNILENFWTLYIEKLNIKNKDKEADQRVIKNNKKDADQTVIFIAMYCELLILFENSVKSIIVPVKNKVNIKNTDIFRSMGIASEIGSCGRGDGVDSVDEGGVGNWDRCGDDGGDRGGVESGDDACVNDGGDGGSALFVCRRYAPHRRRIWPPQQIQGSIGCHPCLS